LAFGATSTSRKTTRRPEVRRGRSTGATLAGLAFGLVLASVVAVASPPTRILADEPGLFGRVLVVAEGHEVALRFGSVAGDDQTVVDRRAPNDLAMAYLRGASLAAFAVDAPHRVLVLGLGGGAFPTFLLRHFPNVEIAAVEIDPVVVQLAHAHFGLPRDPRLIVHTSDARTFVQGAKPGHFDVVLIDAYDADAPPRPLQERQFFSDVARATARRGIAVMNVATDDPVVVTRLRAGFQAAFSTCFELVVAEEGNVLWFGSSAAGPARAAFIDAAKQADQNRRAPFQVLPYALELVPCRRD